MLCTRKYTIKYMCCSYPITTHLLHLFTTHLLHLLSTSRYTITCRCCIYPITTHLLGVHQHMFKPNICVHLAYVYT
jgi:hypothetical protein